jgi:hypothetical protein
MDLRRIKNFLRGYMARQEFYALLLVLSLLALGAMVRLYRLTHPTVRGTNREPTLVPLQSEERDVE